MRRKNPLVSIGMPFLDLPEWQAYGLLVVMCQILITLPLIATLMAAPLRVSGLLYAGVFLYGLGVSAIAIYEVRKMRHAYERQIELINGDKLSRFIEIPWVKQAILASYQGDHSIGITRDPANPKKLAIHVHIAGDDRLDIPSSIIYLGTPVSIVVYTGLAPIVAD